MGVVLNKSVLITGTNRGIGRAMVEAFAAKGWAVIAHARKATGEFDAFCASVAKEFGVSVRQVFFDMADSAAMKESVRGLIADNVNVRALVNSAGIAHGGLFQMTSMQRIREVFDVNLFAHMELTQLLLRYIARNGGGSIVNVASISGIDLKAGNCAYGVSKAALIAFTKTLAAECARDGVRINAICPGLTDTDMARQMEPDAEKEMIGRSAMSRLARPEEIASVAVYLASEESSFVNGQIVCVDGGRA